ncbi:MAG: hypothetical protein BGO78_04950 [Chloroflexi bacterium 44-23]|nr:MAG: hypothetical protein BGO78_04950 [Chloroflexi bacterium 44-23]
MKRIKEFFLAFIKDQSFLNVIRNSGYLFSSNSISSLLASLQGILAAIILGPANYGFLGLIVTFSSNVNRLLSFRMGELVIKFGGSFLEKGEKSNAGAVIKFSGIVEIITSLIAYGLLVLTAPLAAKYILKNSEMTQWIIIYGFALLANFLTETATAILQLADRYKTIAIFNFLQNFVTVAWIAVLYFTNGNLIQVLTAYLIGKFIYGFGIFLSGVLNLNSLIGHGWWKVSMSQIENKKELVNFAISTNLSGTVNLLIRDSEVLWMGFFWNAEIVGYYKFGLAIINPIMMPINSLITTTYPEINKFIALRLWAPLKNLLRKVTLFALLWTSACALGLILFGPWLLGFIKDGKYLPSLAITLILLIGYGTANVLFWNRNLLLAFNRPNAPLFIMAGVGLVKTAAMLIFVPQNGYLFQAGLLSAYFVVSVGLISLLGWIHLRNSATIDGNLVG